MAKSKKQLTHNYRKILRISFWLFLLGATAILIYNQPKFSQQNPELKRLSEQIAKDPKNPQAHLALANSYQREGNLEKAKEETLIALQNSPNAQEVKAALQQIGNLEEESKKVKEEISKWENILSTYPNYRDGFFRLAVLYYQVGEDNKVRWALEKTLAIDPNFEPALKLRSFLN